MDLRTHTAHSDRLIEFAHIPVLLTELLEVTNLQPGDFAIDCTAGGGGHAQAMLNRVQPNGRVLCLDRDSDAITHLISSFRPVHSDGRVVIEHARFSELRRVATKHDFCGNAATVIADLGVSSYQLDTGARGFSFQHEGPLDMRMNPKGNETCAADVINESSCADLVAIFQKYGEEPRSFRIATAITQERDRTPITTTRQLADIVQRAVPPKKGPGPKRHPATQIFQALRIHVNKELEELENMLPTAFEMLKPGGRLGLISFHSLEDRIIKEFCRKLAGLDQPTILHKLPVIGMPGPPPVAKIVRPFPIVPSEAEVALNPRARSAKLRVLEKIS